MEYDVKNYTEQGGEKTVIGGVLEFEEGAKIINMPDAMKPELPVADADTLGGVKIGANLSVDENGKLNMAPLGGVGIGEGVYYDDQGRLCAYPDFFAMNVAYPASTEVADQVMTFNALIDVLIEAGMMEAPEEESAGEE